MERIAPAEFAEVADLESCSSAGARFAPTSDARRFREIREILGMRQKDLAGALDYDVKYISLIESGRRKVSRRTALAMEYLLLREQSAHLKRAIAAVDLLIP